MANLWRKSPSSSLWMCCCVSLAMSSLVVCGAEFQMFPPYKDVDSRLESALNSAEFISANGISNHPNSIISSVGSSSYSGNGQTTGGMSSSYGFIADERTVFETYTMATVNHNYTDYNGEEIQLTGDNNAKFGEGKMFPAQGKLVHVTSARDVTDNTACHPNIRGTAGQDLPIGEPWIALIKRGVCKFEDKVKHAYLHNAVAVIVYNDRESTSLDKMQIVDKERNITAVFTYKRIGEQLAGLLDKGYVVTTNIWEGQTITKQYQNMNRTSVLFVSISFIILMIISLVWLVFYYVQRFRYLQSKDKQSRRMCNVAKRIIAKIPTKSVRPEDKELQNECCPICIEQYRVSDLIRVLPCKHEFHRNCIDPWLLDHRLCPMCKMDILKYYGFVVGVEQTSRTGRRIRSQNTTTVAPRDLVVVVTNSSASSASSTNGREDLNNREFIENNSGDRDHNNSSNAPPSGASLTNDNPTAAPQPTTSSSSTDGNSGLANAVQVENRNINSSSLHSVRVVLNPNEEVHQSVSQGRNEAQIRSGIGALRVTDV